MVQDGVCCKQPCIPWVMSLYNTLHLMNEYHCHFTAKLLEHYFSIPWQITPALLFVQSMPPPVEDMHSNIVLSSPVQDTSLKCIGRESVEKLCVPLVVPENLLISIFSCPCIHNGTINKLFLVPNFKAFTTQLGL